MSDIIKEQTSKSDNLPLPNHKKLDTKTVCMKFISLKKLLLNY